MRLKSIKVAAENSVFRQCNTNSRRLTLTAQTADQVDDSSFNTYLLSIYYVSGTVLNSGDIAMKKTDKYLCPCGVDIHEQETDNIQDRSVKHMVQ